MTVLFTDRCVGCGLCVDNCVTSAIKINDGRITYNDKVCVKCGQCFAICPQGAVEMYNCDPTVDLHQHDKIESAIAMRRSFRKFKPESVDRDLLQHLLDLTRFCPSAKNQRLVQFVVLHKVVLSELRPVIEKFLAQRPRNKAFIDNKVDPVFRGVPHVVLAIVPVGTGTDDGVIALSTFELACQAKNLGTFWCGFRRASSRLSFFQSQDVKNIIGLPDDIEVAGAMGVGWPDVEFCRPAARPNLVYRVVE